jgi:hypothetical protein
MTSRIYAANVRATAVANIKADLLALFATNANGEEVLDPAYVYAYLREQFQTLASDEGLGVLVEAAARAVNPYTLGDALIGKIGLDAFRNRADYPAIAAITPATVGAGIAAGRAKTEARAAEVTGMFAWVQSDALKTLIEDFYREKGIDALVPTGESRVFNTRTYRCAYRTDKGEISKASDASELVTMDTNDSTTVTAAAPPGGRFVDTVLWYRSNDSNSGAAFQFAGEKLVADGLSFTDTKIAEMLGENCPSIEWDEPPADLRGLRLHPSGFAVGFTGNTVCPSVQNRLYAFPVTWRRTVPRPIVGLAVAGQTIFVGTQGEPHLMTGSDPAFLAVERISGGEPCLSARSIVATNKGFVYAGSRGLALAAGIGGTPILTSNHFTKKQWEALNPAAIFAVEHDGCYIFAAGATTYSLGLETGRLATIDLTASAFFKAPNGRLYAVSGTQIVEVFGGAGSRTGYWKSPRQRTTDGASWLRATGDYEAGSCTITWHRHLQDGTTDSRAYVAANRREQRVHPAPAAMDEYEIEVQGQSALTEVRLTDSSTGLK